jgi:DNA-directed RNA polymerase specialized sigma24 family protein
MRATNPRREPFVLERDSFETLLRALHPERRAASEEYERLRARLLRFFDWQGAHDPERLADTSLDRLAMKLHRGEHILDLRNYLHGIARMVLREWRTQRQREEMLLNSASRGMSEAAPEPGGEELYQALEQVLGELPSDQRSLILRYYSAASHGDQIALRVRMAAEFGITVNALRNRMLRLRLEVERCTLRKLSRRKKGWR